MNIIVPREIETARLWLRQFAEDDWRDLHAYYSDAGAMRFAAGEPLSEGQSWRAMATMTGHWELRGYGPYAVVEKKSGRVIGPVGFWFPGDWPEAEIKWGLAPAYWGKGYASEAARAVQRAGSQHLPELRLISLIHRDNRPSIRLAEAIGAVREKAIEFRGTPCYIYRHPVGS